MNLDRDFCIIINDFGRNGVAFVETAPADANYDRAVDDIVTGQYENVRAVIMFNPAERMCRDVTEDILREVECRREAERFDDDCFGGELADERHGRAA